MNRTIATFSSLLFTIAAVAHCDAAEKSPPPTEVLLMTEGAVSPSATVDDVRWLVGAWEGDLEGNSQQHIAYDPVAGQMPGFVRGWTREGTILFYEINVFAEVGDTLEFRVKHFSAELAGWEGKDEFVRHRLVAMTNEAVFFDGITFVKDGPDRHVVHYRIPDGDREGDVIVVHQSRIK